MELGEEHRCQSAFADLGGDFVDAETGADSEGQVADYKISFPKSPLRFRPRLIVLVPGEDDGRPVNASR